MKKLLYVTRLYDSCIDYIHKKHNFSNLTYEAHLNLMMNERVSWSNYLSKSLKKVKVTNIIINDLILQRKWLRLKKKNIKDENILKTQIESIKPDYILFNNIRDFENNIIYCKTKKIKTLFYDGIGSNKLYEYKPSGVITCLKYSYKFYKKNKIPCLYLPHGFDERIKIKSKKKYDIIFIGNISSFKHIKRTIFLYELSNYLKLNLWISEKPNLLKSIFIFFYLLIFQPNNSLKYLLAINLIKKENNGAIYGKDMYELISKSKIVVNFHIDTSKDESANMRMFEVTGLGTCLATDNKKNLKNFFNKSNEILVYNNVKDISKKIKYLLNNESKLKNISRKGRLRTLKNHKLNLRFLKLEKFIKEI